MAAFFSGVRARLLGVGVKVLPQPWAKQRHLADPLRLVPNLMTSFLVPQCGQGKATMTVPYTNNAIRSIAAARGLIANCGPDICIIVVFNQVEGIGKIDLTVRLPGTGRS